MLRACARCGAKNRIPPNRLADPGKCGKCHAPLPPHDKPIDVPDAATFDAIVASATVPVLVDFWAEWCGPCRMVAPEVKKVAHAQAGKLLVLKVDTDALEDLSARYQIRSIPNFAVFRGGQLMRQRAGATDHRELARWAIQP